MFEVFQPVWKSYLNVTDRQTDGRIDGQTDDLLWHNRALCCIAWWKLTDWSNRIRVNVKRQTASPEKPEKGWVKSKWNNIKLIPAGYGLSTSSTRGTFACVVRVPTARSRCTSAREWTNWSWHQKTLPTHDTVLKCLIWQLLCKVSCSCYTNIAHFFANTHIF